mgnify:CR=1 FL=1
MAIEVGDLVRIRGQDWLGRPLGIVTDVRELVHDQSGEKYLAVTAVAGGTEFTFGEANFELVNKAEREEK